VLREELLYLPSQRHLIHVTTFDIYYHYLAGVSKVVIGPAARRLPTEGHRQGTTLRRKHRTAGGAVSPPVEPR
jgi:hypothetical protein